MAGSGHRYNWDEYEHCMAADGSNSIIESISLFIDYISLLFCTYYYLNNVRRIFGCVNGKRHRVDAAAIILCTRRI